MVNDLVIETIFSHRRFLMIVDFCIQQTIFKANHSMIASQYNICVNFINILLNTFSYKIILRSFSLVTVWLMDLLVQEYRRKHCSLNVDEIDYIVGAKKVAGIIIPTSFGDPVKKQ